MDALKPIVCYCALCTGLLLFAAPTHAQNSDDHKLQLLTPVEGRVASGDQESWTFDAADGEMLSFYVKDISGGFDPMFKISNNSGEELISNDDYNYPTNGDALLEAITVPRTGAYTVIVAGFQGQAGAYRLTMLPGFSQVAVDENFSGNPTWKALGEPLQADVVDGKLTLALEGMRLRGVAINSEMDTPANYYAQADLTTAGGQDGWIVGMAARLQDADHFALLEVNSNGQWRFLLHLPEGDQIVHDWTPHPAIVPGQNRFTLGLMANGVGYEFFYDGQLFGQSSDETLSPTGTLGLAVETQGSPTSHTNALFGDLVITVPTLVNNQPIIPQQIVIGKPSDMVQELQRRSLIPGGGEIALTVNESFVESRHPGVERLLLGRGTTYQDFVMGTTVSWKAASPGMTGCGLVLRAADDTHYVLAYIDQTGGYGLSQRAGDAFQPGIFGETPDFKGDTHDMLVIARKAILYYYIDGQYKGTLENKAVDGAVGNAVINFEPISTSCTFADTWLWRWTEN